jgi:hypothetical protein
MFANMLATIRKIFAESAKCWTCEVDLLAEAEGLVTPGWTPRTPGADGSEKTSARGGVSFAERTSKPPPIDTGKSPRAGISDEHVVLSTDPIQKNPNRKDEETGFCAGGRSTPCRQQ